MKPNFYNCSDIKGLRFFTIEICPYCCCFLHTQKDSRGASIHKIDKSFPLKPSLVPHQIVEPSHDSEMQCSDGRNLTPSNFNSFAKQCSYN